jgi:hypothetical protein
MRTKLISLLLAASVAATAGLSPAQAQGFDRNAQRQAATIALGIATIAIIAKAAEAEREREKERKKDRERERERERQRAEQNLPTIITESGRPLPRVYPREEFRPQTHARALSVPSSCARRVQTEGGVRTAFGAPCLRRAGVDIARLPDTCERLADVGDRDVRIWGARCLQRNGVRID